ncbi:hypothetical protein [Haloferax volcanii]|uniref:Uncharacterized protein n=1 Tax=Haloferax volcanii JCM 10717 TaxID=1227458 RepID=M0HR95_HALVO|nr:hypothetical protein [Haloferax alexandrinus]ELZ87105.1 hypothetical protein C452_15939 [Haloferax alexandrinus JCM 10717]WEL30519.1 ATP-dependent carboxylate-amine ligase [Haloferax alexandrinus]
MGGDEPTVTVRILGFHDDSETKAISNAVTALGHETLWPHEGGDGIEVLASSVAPDPKPAKRPLHRPQARDGEQAGRRRPLMRPDISSHSVNWLHRLE